MGNKNLKNIILTGLDGSGLTTILNYYNKGFFFKSSITKIPAIGINVETMELNNLKFFKFGVGAYRNKLDLEYTSIADAIIFVINSEKDEENSVIKFIEHTKVYLHSLLNDNSMKNCPFLILANKQDLESSLKTEELYEKLELDKIDPKRLYFIGTVAITGQGLDDGIMWLTNKLDSKEDNK